MRTYAQTRIAVFKKLFMSKKALKSTKQMETVFNHIHYNVIQIYKYSYKRRKGGDAVVLEPSYMLEQQLS